MLKNRNLWIMSIAFLVFLISPLFKAQGFIENTGYFNGLLAPEARSLHLNFNILTLIGLIGIVTFLGGKLAQRFGLPQIIGFIVTGVLFGPSFLDIVPLELSGELIFISEIALGLIGFDIGSHLRVDELRKLGRSIVSILVFEAFGTFLLVTVGIFMIIRDWNTALILGAISSATAPAATVDVLDEYGAKGPLTTSRARATFSVINK